MKREQYTSFTPTDFPFDLLTSGITTSDQNHIVERENCAFYILEYICTGSGVLLCNGHKYNVSAGDVFILPKGSNHQYYSENNWTKIWFNIDGALVSNLLHTYNLGKTVVFRNFYNQNLFDDFYKITTSSQPVEDIIFSSALMFHSIVQKLFLSRTEAHSNTAYTIKKLIDKDLYQEKISISAIANQLYISKSKLIDVFKKSYNTTPYQYFTSKRLEIAASLLLSSDYSITEITDMLHYTDTSSFSNAFKKYMGMSPKAYKKINTSDSSHITNFYDKDE